MSECITTSGFQMAYVPPPGPPLNLSASAASPSSLVLNWSAAVPQPGTSIASYTVYRFDSGNWPHIAQVAGLTYTDTGLNSSTQYTYEVRATDNKGAVSGYSNPASATTLAPLPAAPTGLQVTATTSSSVSLSWVAATGATTYNLYRNGVLARSGIAGTSVTDTSLTASTTYTYFLTGVNASGEGPHSNSVNGTTSAATTSGIKAFIKSIFGHYAHMDNFQWQSSTGVAQGQQNTFNAVITKLMTNLNMRGVVIYFRWGDCEQIQGNYTPLDNAMTTIFNKITSVAASVGRNLTTNPFYVGIIGPSLRLFPQGGGKLNNDNWPPYAQTGGMVADVSNQYGGTNVASQFTFSAAGLSAIDAIHAHAASKWGGHPLLAFWAVHDESTFFVSGQGNDPITITVSTMTPTYTQMIVNQAGHWKDGSGNPTSPIMARANFFSGANDPAEGTTFGQTLAALGPQIIFGWPDPAVRNSSFQKIARGAAGTWGDQRKIRVFAGMVQETYLGGTPNPFNVVPPADIAASEMGAVVPNQVTSQTFWAGMGRSGDPTPPAGSATFNGTSWTPQAPYDQHSYIMIWNVSNAYVYQFDTNKFQNAPGGVYPNGFPTTDQESIVQTINAMAGATNTDTPSSLQ